MNFCLNSNFVFFVYVFYCFFFFQAEDGIRDIGVTGVQTCALPILLPAARATLEQHSASDFFFHAVIQTEQQLAELGEYATRHGVTSFKAYMAGKIGRAWCRERV